MDVIFLDIDGVLVHEEHIIRSGVHRSLEFCPLSVRRLKEIIHTTSAFLVVSSTWRLGHTVESFRRDILDYYGLGDFLVGLTPVDEDSNAPRGKEIQEYLDSVRNTSLQVSNFIILDDDSDMGHLSHRLVKCDSRTGLTEEVKRRALKLFYS